MRYEINYQILNLTEIEKRKKAVNDVKEYSIKSYNVLHDFWRVCNIYAQFSFGAAFVGIEGYPVAALWDHFKELYEM